jgi:hypothetical protein
VFGAYSDRDLVERLCQDRAVPVSEVVDGSAADFAAGTTDAGAYVAGEVILTPHLVGDFTGDSVPDGWTVEPWVAGGTGTVGDGVLALDGAKVGCEPLLQSPRSLEMSAVFAARPDQDAGFGTNFVDVPWVMFSTKWGRRLYGRTHLLSLEDKKMSADWFGARHRFRIDWNVLDIVFSVDGARQAHLMIPIPGYMRAIASNRRLGTEPLRVEWMRLSPYAPAGRFTSRVLDAGAAVAWSDLSWEADVPDATRVGIDVRAGDVARPGRSWTPWRRLADSGDEIAVTARFLQYRAHLATDDGAWTPALRRVTARYSAGVSSSSSFVSGSTLGCQ